MEQQGTVVPQWRPATKSPNGVAGGGDRRLISLRKYSLAICLVETLAIVLLVYLLLKIPPPSEQFSATTLSGNVSNLSAPYRTYYSSGPNSTSTKSASLLLGLVNDCDQRRHDLDFSVQCPSSQPDSCAPVEKSDQEAQLAMKRRNIGQRADPWLVSIIETSKSGARMAHKCIKLKKVSCGPLTHCGRFKTRIEVNPNKRHQKIVGWGGALTDSAINNILALTMNGTRRLLEDYFGPDGLRFNMVRVTIGGSDFSGRFYTNDDLNDQDLDEEEARWLREFKLREEDLLYKIPMLQVIKREFVPEMKLFGTMWSPPLWMKTNHHFNKGQLRGSIDDEPLPHGMDASKTSERFYQTLARIKLNFLEEYRKRGLPFWGLTVMNEPAFAASPFLDFNTMIFPRDDYGNYVAKYLGPLVRSNATTHNLKLMVHDDNRRFLRNFTKTLLDQTRFRQFVDGVSVHGYIDEEYDQMDHIYEHYKPQVGDDSNSQPDDWFVLPTELCSAHLPFMQKALAGNWHRGLHYALDIIRSLQHSAAGWVDWNMALDTEGGPGWLRGRLDAAVLVDKTRDLYHKSPMFYVLGQFSRYIAPESVRVETQTVNGLYDSHFEVVTFELPAGREAVRQLATVVVNNNPYPIKAHLRVSSLGGQEGARESDTYSLLECPPDSVITLVYSAQLNSDSHRDVRIHQ